MRKRIVAGNWKMNCTPSQAKKLAEDLKKTVDTEACQVVFCVPFINLQTVLEVIKGSHIALGAQNMYFEDSGAYTGEISADMLKEAGVEYVIIGHSERRQYFGETDEMVNCKVLKALEKGLIPIVCVGETLVQREQDVTVDLIRMQVRIALKDVSAEQAEGIVIAYEPVWAIGTGKTATSQQAQEACAAIRQVLSEIYDDRTAKTVRIQYGGSVNGGNAKELFAMPDIDGGLIGGASIKPDFQNIVHPQ